MNRLWSWCAPLAWVLSACSTPQTAATVKPSAVAQALAGQASDSEQAQVLPQHWRGRLSINVHQTPMQTVFAGFEIDGHEQAGEMRILGPLGSVALWLRWQPGQASASDGQSTRTAPDLPQLMQHLTGIDLPIALIFDALYQRRVEIPGWWIEPPQGQRDRLYAVRLEPQPRIELWMTFQMATP